MATWLAHLDRDEERAGLLRGSTDRVLTLAYERTCTVDEKFGTNDWLDSLLEQWSDEARRRPGAI